MADLESLFSVASPLPFISEKGVFDGWEIAASSCCKNCDDHVCLSSQISTKTHSVCPKGMSFNPIAFMGNQFVLGGYINENRNNKVSGDRRKALKRLWLSDNDISIVSKNLASSEVKLSKELDYARS